MPLRYGMKFVLQDLWEPDVMLRLVAEEGVTWTMGATAFVLDACAAVDRVGGSVDLPTFRFFSCGGAPIPPAPCNWRARSSARSSSRCGA